MAMVTCFLMYFFRDPLRTPPENSNAILAPADGTVIKVKEVNEPYLLKGKFPGFIDSISRRTVKGLIRFVFSLADRTTAPTEELAKELRQYGIKNVVVLHNGVDLKKLLADGELARAFRGRYGLPQDKKVILYVGRIGFEKRLEVLLRSLTMVRSTDWCLVVVGSGPQLDEYKKQAMALGLAERAIFTGFVKGDLLNGAYGCADMFVSPSDSETFGLTLIEAMAFGLPVIGVDKLGPGELIKDGRNGFLVKPGDSRAMAGLIDRLLREPGLRPGIGAEAKKTAESFAIGRSAEATLKMYKELIESRKRK